MKYYYVYYLIIFALNVKSEFSESDILNNYNLILNNEHLIVRPPGANQSYDEPVIVQVKLFIDNIEKIDENNMEIRIQMTLHISWIDSRLELHFLKDNHPKFLLLKDTSKNWIPRIVFENEKLRENRNAFTFRLFSNGLFVFREKLLVTFDFPMNLKRFPFDIQICSIKITNVDYTTKDIQLQWNNNDTIQITQNMIMPHFTFEKYEIKTINTKSNSGEQCSLVVNFVLIRDCRFYLFKYYLPVLIIVLISWLPLWLERILILRIYIALCTVIFLGWHYLVQSNELMVSYITALDLWRGINFIFVFTAAMESIIITHMIKTNRNKIKRTHPDDSEKYKMLPCPNCPEKKKYLEVTEEKTDIDLEIMKIKANFKICFINVYKEVEIIDCVAKLFFPSAYSIFLFFYWIKY